MTVKQTNRYMDVRSRISQVDLDKAALIPINAGHLHTRIMMYLKKLLNMTYQTLPGFSIGSGT